MLNLLFMYELTNPPVSRALQANFNKSVFNENLRVVKQQLLMIIQKELNRIYY